MKDEVIERFKAFKGKTSLGCIPCLAQAIRGKRLSEAQIKRYLFRLCMPEEDFLRKEAREIIRWLWSVSNGKRVK